MKVETTQGFVPVKLVLIFERQDEIDDFQRLIRSGELHERLQNKGMNHLSLNLRDMYNKLQNYTMETGMALT